MPFNVKTIKNLRGEDGSSYGFDPDVDNSPQKTENNSFFDEEQGNKEKEVNQKESDVEKEKSDLDNSSNADELFSEDIQSLDSPESEQNSEGTKETPALEQETTEKSESPSSEQSTGSVEESTEEESEFFEEEEEEEDELPTLDEPDFETSSKLEDSKKESGQEDEEVDIDPTTEAVKEKNDFDPTEEYGLSKERYQEIVKEINNKKVDNSAHTTTQLKLSNIVKILIPIAIITILLFSYLVVLYLGVAEAVLSTVPTVIILIVALYFLAQDFTPN